MKCPNCGSLQSTCVDSRLSEDQTIRMRRHRCRDCGQSWPTTEMSDVTLLALQQKARAPFLDDRKRLASIIGELDQLKTKYTKMLQKEVVT